MGLFEQKRYKQKRVVQKNFDINQMRDFGFCNSLHPVDHNIFLMHSLMLKRAGMRDR